MSLNSTEIALVISHIASLCQGGRVQKVFGRDKDSVVLRVRGPEGSVFMLLSAHPRLSRVHTLPAKGDWTLMTPFVTALRQRLHGAHVDSVEADHGDRRCRLRFSSAEKRHVLEIELFGVGSNLVLVGEDGRIVEALRHSRGEKRTVMPGHDYAPPPQVEPRTPTSRFGDAPEAVDRAVSEAYEPRRAKEGLEEARRRLAQRLKAARKRAAGKVGSLERAIDRLEHADVEKRRGELLKASMHLFKPGLDSVRVIDYYDPQTPEVAVPVDPKMAPAANVERYFKRYRKIKTAADLASKELPGAQAELDRVRQAASKLADCATPAEIDDVELGFFGRAGGGKPKGQRAPVGPRPFTSCDGFAILVGRTEAENDQVTFRMAKGNDYWFHVQGLPGSHVIVRAQRGKSLPLDTMLDAAALAKLYSSAKDADAVDVDYTQRKFVKKRRGGGPGDVDYWDYKTLHVGQDQARLTRLFSGDSS